MVGKLLLVDDEEGIRKVLSISLMDCGYQVWTAQNGEEALRLFEEIRPQIVLTDIKMPGMDGIELLQRIKKDAPDTEVIMITGHGEMDLAIRSLKHEATDFITKPIHDEVLEIALKRAQERISMRAALREYTDNLEKLVRDKTQQLLESERLAAVGQTVADLAHAIKNITGGLKGGVFVVEKGFELDNRQYLMQGWDMVKSNVEKIANMALDLLNYSKEREPDYELCDPNQPAREVCSLMQSRCRDHSVTLVEDLEQDMAPCWMDREGIHRCLLNLVTNAIDACGDMPDGTRPREVAVRSRMVEGRCVEYRVEDNGCGMDQETRSKLFQRFFSTKGTKGTGLGLMISKKIVDEHGGRIEVDSEEGKGTKFCIRLPPVRKGAESTI
ncbi:MAG TPA: hybrid sensor histidine kinase/response regulator [Syntrophobacteraceae bacterium]|nr:hybrid sensor histidine kinase/response regulator [Syntrophobacteraceae bacterium]